MKNTKKGVSILLILFIIYSPFFNLIREDAITLIVKTNKSNEKKQGQSNNS